ncbi:trypsin-like peptidase domain-containing protein [Actinokineospora enzanensis]|uniref:trypsin-like peptidase domain-containing protein n=1 Tax=Actinokineospora enzanensis TaxID=155975 RepID=UPI001FE184FA|nr:trypsin-like peptidase domain-containing protein [Actinokineospora enzanensis]
MDRPRRLWQARLHDEAGRTIGAAIVLDQDHILTCAHIADPAAPILVHFRGADKATAHVLDGHRVPATSDERGNVALLKLAEPFRAAESAPLRRKITVDDQIVDVYGFAETSDSGSWTSATLADTGVPGSEWLRLHRDAEPITRGFSGAPVLEPPSGDVIGMAVSNGHQAWMIPVETMAGHLPALSRWLTGTPALDDTFATVTHDGVDLTFTREVVAWFAGAGSPVWVVITGDARSPRARAFRLGVALADRERAPRLSALLPDLRPRPGSVHVAVDAAGKTSDQVGGRIAERIGPGSTALRTIVVDGIDEAIDPDHLVRTVIAPLATSAGVLGLRLVLGFRHEASPAVTVARSLPGTAHPPGPLDDRIKAMAELVDELAAIEEHHQVMAPRFTGVPRLALKARRLGGALTQLRTHRTAGDATWVARKLGDCERSITVAVEAGRRGRAGIDHLVSRRAELRARLAAYAEMARDHDLVEDAALDTAYGRAYRLLFEGPCDIEEAGRAVDAYIAVVRGRIEGRG